MRFQSLDQITFLLPVPIGAVLHLTSKVVKTTRPHAGKDGEAKVHIQVVAEVEEVETGVSAAHHDSLPHLIYSALTPQLRRETNTFYFTMAKDDPAPIGRTVVPRTYNEAMTYLEAQRRLAHGAETRRLYRSEKDAGAAA